jgi:hypothetical protein
MHTAKGDTAPAFSGLCVYLQFMWEVGLPPSPVQFSSHCPFISFPAPDYWAVLLLLPAAMFIYSSCGKWVFPPLLWSFPPSATLTSFPAPGCWACAPAPARASPTHPGRIPFPNLQCSVCPPLLPRVFIVLIAYYSVSPFSLGGGQSVQGAMLLWPRVVCGSIAVLQSSPCPRLPKLSGHGRLAARGPPFFSI